MDFLKKGRSVRKYTYNELKEFASSLNLLELETLERVVGLELGKGGGSESIDLEINALLEISKLHGVPLKNAIDIGANEGLWSIALAKKFPNLQIWCLEPQKNAFDLAVINLKMNQLDNVFPINFGLTPKHQDSMTLYKDVDGSGMASIYKRRLDHFGLDFGLSEDVPSISVAELASREELFGVNVVKLDVEGAEFPILQELTVAFYKRLNYIQFEFGGCNIDSRTFFQDFWYLLTENGFEIYRISPRGVIKLEGYKESYEYFSTTNFIAVGKN